MYVYKKQTEGRKKGSFQVGYFHPETLEFKVASRHTSDVKARRRVNYLNGGAVPKKARS